MTEADAVFAAIQRVHEEMDAMVSAWNRVELRAMNAAMEERTKIVAWLREPGWERTFELEAIIKDIEAGEHLK